MQGTLWAPNFLWAGISLRNYTGAKMNLSSEVSKERNKLGRTSERAEQRRCQKQQWGTMDWKVTSTEELGPNQGTFPFGGVEGLGNIFFSMISELLWTSDCLVPLIFPLSGAVSEESHQNFMQFIRLWNEHDAWRGWDIWQC